MAAIVPYKSKVCSRFEAKIGYTERFCQATNVLLVDLLILKMHLAFFKNVEKIKSSRHSQYKRQHQRYDAWI